MLCFEFSSRFNSNSVHIVSGCSLTITFKSSAQWNLNSSHQNRLTGPSVVKVSQYALNIHEVAVVESVVLVNRLRKKHGVRKKKRRKD